MRCASRWRRSMRATGKWPFRPRVRLCWPPKSLRIRPARPIPARERLLMSIKQRTGIPGGACEFDLPSYHYWLHRPAEDRTGQLAAWTGPLYPLRDGSAIILRILRESGRPQSVNAPQGMFQQMLGGKTAQMLRLRLEPTAACVPEISANKYVLNIRFLSQSDARTRTADWDVPFELTFC